MARPEGEPTASAPLYRDRRRADSFGDDAERYDRTRPTYPPAMVDDLVAGAGGPGARVLDVGCGTGIAARLFLRRGCSVLGVEPDPRMAQVARRHGVEVEEGSLEGWDPRGRRFDLLSAAQCWHWVDPVAGALKAAEVLRPGGRIGLYWNRGVPPDDVRVALDEVYRRTAPGLDEHSILLGSFQLDRFDLATEGLVGTGRFTEVTRRSYRHSQRYTTAEWLDLLPTHSDHHALAPEVLGRLLVEVGGALDRLGGSMALPYETTLVTGVLGGRRAPEDAPGR